MNMKNKLLCMLIILPAFIFSFKMSAFGQEGTSKKKDMYDSLQVLTINGIITAVYDLISGPAGERNWNKFKFFCLPNATFISMKKHPDGSEEFFSGDIDDYIKKISPTLEKSAYYENEVERNIQSSDNIANVFSTYQSVLFANDGTVNLKGVNSFQLVYKNNRWYIANILWKNEPL